MHYRTKKAFTLIESLISMLIISSVLIVTIYLVNGYYKQTLSRDIMLKSMLSNITEIEKMKSNVKTLDDLHNFARDKDIKIIAIEENEFSDNFKSSNLYRIEVGGKIPNTKLITILRLAGDGV